MTTMNAIQEIKGMLQRFPQISFEASINGIKVLPISNTGFTVEIIKDIEQYTVFFGGWHQSFTDAEEAINCFWFGLSTGCRLKEYRRWGFAYRWALEYKEAGEWIEDSRTTLLLFPYIGAKKVRVLQNRVISNEENFE